jgi:adenine-specific DNA-methyltransferase
MPVIQFKGKTAIESYHHTVPHHTLEFDPKLSELPKGEKPSLDGNLIIEGENLLALKALLPTHAGRIKCIYIDPPYNTGNEDWVYNDNLTQPQFKEWIGKTVGKEGDDFTRHDKWCCMMYPRLELLKSLLRNDGAIFVSIDDNEFQHLKMLMIEIFGEENFVATFVWEKRTTRENRRVFSFNHDYILCFARSKGLFEDSRNLLPYTDEARARYSNPDNDPRKEWQSVSLNAQAGHATADQFYKITTPGGRILEAPPGRCWTVTKKKMNELIADKRVWFGEDGNNVPRRKVFLSEVTQGLTPHTLWEAEEVGTSDSAKKELIEIFSGKSVYETPKPVELIKRIIQIASSEDDLVLDSFGGSGTTAHAVLLANKEDGGTRSFVLAQLPYDTKEQEKGRFNICQQVTAQRVRRVIDGYTSTTQKGKKEKKAALAGTFTYAKVGSSLFGEYRDLGKKLPSYEELAKYIFYTETSRDFDKKFVNSKTGKIGEYRKTSYYLLYTPNNKEDQALDLKWLRSLEKSEKNRNLVVYCEKIWIHRDDLAKYEKDTARKVRPMLVPFNLK